MYLAGLMLRGCGMGDRRRARGFARALRATALLLCATTLCLLSLLRASVAYAAGSDLKGDLTNRYNVVIVTDASGSMSRTDPDNLRGAAIARFVALLAQEGNRVGAVAFGEGIPLQSDLRDLTSVQSRQEFVQRMDKVALEDWTNIGEGLRAAIGMLDSQRDTSLPSIILLLSDGNTDMPSDEARQASLQTKAQAIEAARGAGYKIYAVSLNANGEADSNELRQVASATGGEFREVTSASDLQDVYDLYYSLVFSAKADQGSDVVIPDSGIVSGAFDVASIGVEEANVLITGTPTDYSFTRPDGTSVTRDQLAGSTFSTEALTAVKVREPLAGTWRYTVRGVPKDHVRVDIVRNTDVSVRLESSASGSKLSAGDSVDFTATILESGRPVKPEVYGGFSGELVIEGAGGSKQALALTAGEGGFALTVPFPDRGSFAVHATASGEGYELSTQTLSLNVGNSAPVPGEAIQATVNLWPFIDNTATIDLTPGATDTEDGELSYEVESSAFMPDEYKIDGSKLVLSGYSLPEGSFTVRATDSDGASCTFDVHVKTVNIGLITCVVILGAILLALVVAGVLLRILLNKRFYGTCYVRPMDNESSEYQKEASLEGSRGRIKLALFGVETYGIDPQAYFQASGKDYVTFVSKVPVYSGGHMQRKVRVGGNGYEVPIAVDEKGQKGVVVRFKSELSRSR